MEKKKLNRVSFFTNTNNGSNDKKINKKFLNLYSIGYFLSETSNFGIKTCFSDNTQKNNKKTTTTAKTTKKHKQTNTHAQTHTM